MDTTGKDYGKVHHVAGVRLIAGLAMYHAEQRLKEYNVYQNKEGTADHDFKHHSCSQLMNYLKHLSPNPC
jgi:hypothetical protein